MVRTTHQGKRFHKSDYADEDANYPIRRKSEASDGPILIPANTPADICINFPARTQVDIIMIIIIIPFIVNIRIRIRIMMMTITIIIVMIIIILLMIIIIKINIIMMYRRMGQS